MKSHYKNYKYICHLHIKNKLGFVFPESYYEIINGYSESHNLFFYMLKIKII